MQVEIMLAANTNTDYKDLIRQINYYMMLSDTRLDIIRMLYDIALKNKCRVNEANSKKLQKVINHFPTEVDGLPFLLEGESFIWSNLQTDGTIKKRATWLEVVTNYRILQYSIQRHAANYVTLATLEDVVVMNQKKISQSSGYASYGRSRYHIAGIGGSRSTGMTFGDIVFVSQGRPFITFRQVQDPHGLAKLIKSASK